MARLVCPLCKTGHRVTIGHPAYRELPCRRCGHPIPLSLAEISSAALPAAPAEREELDPATALAALAAVAADTNPGLGLARRAVEDQTALAWDERINLPGGPGKSGTPGSKPDASPGGSAPPPEQTPVDAGASEPPAASQPRCPGCQGLLRPGAAKCPHCKRYLGPGAEPASARLGRLLAWGIGIAALLALVLVLLLLRRAGEPG